ncbi:MAG: DNA-binding protein WhiA [Lachnospiraceae bacterium]|nr:DNA-binding protein WhiA [Lachnospiraceae bacterium]
MSFSGKVKDELIGKMPPSRHCQLAELAGLFHSCGQIGVSAEGTVSVGFSTEKEPIVRKGFTLLKKTFNIVGEFNEKEASFMEFLTKIGNPEEPVNPLLIKNSCCQRAFLRGFFLGCGSVSDPAKTYHLEFVCPGEEPAAQVVALLKDFDIDAKTTERRKSVVVYVKEGESIVELFGVMEATGALMEMENARILKEVNNTVNRRVNCEMSNIRKIVGASSRQVEDIKYIRDNYGLEKLPESLRQMAAVRIENPESPLGELGELLDPPVGKSGVNHRLRRLGEMADRLRETGSI